MGVVSEAERNEAVNAVAGRLSVPGCAGELTRRDSAEVELRTYPISVTLGKRTRLRVKPWAQRQLNQCLFACRWVWNWGLEREIAQYARYKAGAETDPKTTEKKRHGAYGLSAMLTKLLHGDAELWGAVTIRSRDELTPEQILERKQHLLGTLQHVSRPMLDLVLRDLDLAYQHTFRRLKTGGENAGFPKFKSAKFHRQGVRFIARVSIRDGKVRLPKIGWVPFYEKEYLPNRHYSDVKFAAVERVAGRWYLSVCLDEEVYQWPMGTEDLIIVCERPQTVIVNGERITLPIERYLETRRLARLQRRVSRRDPNSKRRERARIHVARAHETVAAKREYRLHTITTALVRRARSIRVVGFDVKRTIESEKNRTADQLTDAAYGEFFRQLQYKCEWHGRTYDYSVGDYR